MGSGGTDAPNGDLSWLDAVIAAERNGRSVSVSPIGDHGEFFFEIDLPNRYPANFPMANKREAVDAAICWVAEMISDLQEIKKELEAEYQRSLHGS